MTFLMVGIPILSLIVYIFMIFVLFKEDAHFFEIGKSYFIRTATMYQVGRIKRVESNYIVLEDASWIPITGRFNEIFINGIFKEVEPFKDDVYVSLPCMIDATLWTHPLPRQPK